MNCPRCDKAMIILELEGVEIDHCQACGGIWLDAGELERLLREKSEQVINDFVIEKRSREKKFRCPACGRKMKKVVCGETHIDSCEKGHGIWFDTGELAEIIAFGDLNSKVLKFLDNMFEKTIQEGE